MPPNEASEPNSPEGPDPTGQDQGGQAAGPGTAGGGHPRLREWGSGGANAGSPQSATGRTGNPNGGSGGSRPAGTGTEPGRRGSLGDLPKAPPAHSDHLPPPPGPRPPGAPETGGAPGSRSGPPNRRVNRREELARLLEAATTEQKERLKKVNRHVIWFGFLSLVTMICLILPLPWPAVAFVALPVALVVAIRGIVLARRDQLTKGATVYLAFGLALLGVFGLYTIPLLITWGPQWDYQQCLQQAVTIEGRDACLTAFEQATKPDWTRLLNLLGR